MTNNQTITYFVIITVYLIGLSFFLTAMSDDISIKYSAEDKKMPTLSGGSSDSCDCGTITCSEYRLIYGQTALDNLCLSREQVKTGIFGKMVVSIESLPLWANTIFIIIPALLWILCAVLLLLHG